MAIESDWEAINIEKNDEVSAILEERGILDDDIKMVIHNAEATQEKMYKPETGECLAKLMIGETLFHVQYLPIDKKHHNKYSSNGFSHHHSKIIRDHYFI